MLEMCKIRIDQTGRCGAVLEYGMDPEDSTRMMGELSCTNMGCSLYTPRKIEGVGGAPYGPGNSLNTKTLSVLSAECDGWRRVGRREFREYLLPKVQREFDAERARGIMTTRPRPDEDYVEDVTPEFAPYSFFPGLDTGLNI